jgi:8-oxo-dGTP pyrophosphatase MutT (NUDIX family)
VTAGHRFRDRVITVLNGRARVRYDDSKLRPAAVLLPFFATSSPEEPHVWLLRRSDELRTHAGQVAFPGGQPDPDDADLLATALRETNEEIALPPEAVQVLGALDEHATVTGYVITPYVGWIDASFQPTAHATEVSRVFAVPLAVFEAAPEPLTVRWGSTKRIVLSYRAEGEVIWGATAAILRGFVTLMAGSQVP